MQIPGGQVFIHLFHSLLYHQQLELYLYYGEVQEIIAEWISYMK